MSVLSRGQLFSRSDVAWFPMPRSRHSWRGAERSVATGVDRRKRGNIPSVGRDGRDGMNGMEGGTHCRRVPPSRSPSLALWTQIS
jgi:hypothetical protein